MSNLPIWSLTAAPFLDVADLFKHVLGGSAPHISRNSRATHGKRHASQLSRANRRKAKARARNRR